MSEKVISLADRRKLLRPAEAQPIAPLSLSTPSFARPAAVPRKVTERGFIGDIFQKMSDSIAVGEGEDNTASLMVLAMGLEMRLESIQAPQNATKTQQAKILADKYSDELLGKLMRDATEQQIAMKPHFFQGLVASAFSRSVKEDEENKTEV